MARLFASVWQSEDGATAIEYGLMVALVAVSIIAALQFVGTGMSSTFHDIGNRL